MEKIAGDESEILEPFETTSDVCFLAGSKLVPKSRIHELLAWEKKTHVWMSLKRSISLQKGVLGYITGSDWGSTSKIQDR